MSLRPESPIIYSKTLAKIDDTIARSQQAVGSSMDYVRSSKYRPVEFPELLRDEETGENATGSEKEPSLDPALDNLEPDYVATNIDPKPETLGLLRKERDILENQIKDLGSKLKTEEYLKSSYEKTVKELRDRIRDLEDLEEHQDEQKREIKSVNEALKVERASKALVSNKEAALMQRIENQDRRIRELERMLRNPDSDSVYLKQIDDLKATVERLTRENQQLETALRSQSRDDAPATLLEPSSNRVDLLEKKLEAIDARYRSQTRANEELQRQMQLLGSHSPADFTKSENATLVQFEEKMKHNSKKIKVLEEKVKRATDLYEDLRIKMTRSPAAMLHTHTCDDAEIFHEISPRERSDLKRTTKKSDSRKAKTKGVTSKHRSTPSTKSKS